MSENIMFFLMGMTAGSAVIWWHFARNKMLRSREEWEKAWRDKDSP